MGGGIWGAIPGAFKGYFGVNEILSTIMLNLVAVQVMNYLLAGPLRDKTADSVGGLIPQTQTPPGELVAPDPEGRHAAPSGRGRGRPGRRCRLRAALADQLRVPAFARSGFRATLRRMRDARRANDDIRAHAQWRAVRHGRRDARLREHLAPDGHGRQPDRLHRVCGFNGIVVALFGGLNPLWTILSSFIFAGLLVGGDAMQVATNVPSDLIVALNGLVVIFVVSVEFLRHRPRASDAATPGGPPESLAERVEQTVATAGPA